MQRILLHTATLSILLAALISFNTPHALAQVSPDGSFLDGSGDASTLSNPPPAGTQANPDGTFLNGSPDASTLTAPSGATVVGPAGPGTQSNSASGGGNLLVNPLKNIGTLPDLLKAIIGALVDIGTIVLILAFIWVGFSFVRAQGKPEELAKARSALLWTIIGGLILLGAQALSLVIQSTVQSL